MFASPSLAASPLASLSVASASLALVVGPEGPAELTPGPALVESRPLLSKVQASAKLNTTRMAIPGRMP